MTPFLRKPVPLGLLAMAIAAIAAVLVVSLFHDPAGGVPKFVPNPKYATQGTSQAAVRSADVKVTADEIKDSANETCESRTVAQWAQILGTAATPAAIARKFARQNYELSVRAQAYEGCRQTLVEQEQLLGTG